MPDNFDIVELGCVFGQPLDRAPMLALIERFEREHSDVDRSLVFDQAIRRSFYVLMARSRKRKVDTDGGGKICLN